MTRDDIIRMAREAGFDVEPDEWHWLERFAALVAAHKTEVAIAEAYRCGYEAGVIEEREGCAKLADAEVRNTAMLTSMPPQSAAAFKIAAAIRNRGKE